ncbi:MAG TPA: hypothetical protein PKZ32_13380 [Candidatus Melainabacteria bacterium]|nr:hypothetical protein [Candidatus Melainabacteria bacterium]
MLALPRADLEHCIKVGTFGLSRSHTIKNVKAGDKVVCCATKEWSILALGEATTVYYVDDKPVFLRAGIFIDRFDFRVKVLRKEEELAFKPLIAEMEFIKKKEYWPVHFKVGITKITERDFQHIEKWAVR